MRVGQILRNRYKILKELGSGALGDTYLAEDRDLPGYPQCVVKRLKSNPDPVVQQIVQRLFDLEAKKLYELGQKCDRIPKLFAHFEEGGQFYLVQEWIDGQVLDEEIVPGKTFSESYVRKLLRDTLDVLAVIRNYGNVWEWCADDWHDSYQSAPNDGNIWLNSDGNSSAEFPSDAKLLRGGSWNDNPRYCRCAYRNGHNPDGRNNGCGFRVISPASRTS
jgi:serine/threonine protein kinase